MFVFSKDAMIGRLAVEGRLGQVTEEAMTIMSQLDGLEAVPNLWRQTVYGEDNAYYCVLDGRQFPVNGRDCIER